MKTKLMKNFRIVADELRPILVSSKPRTGGSATAELPSHSINAAREINSTYPTPP